MAPVVTSPPVAWDRILSASGRLEETVGTVNFGLIFRLASLQIFVMPIGNADNADLKSAFIRGPTLLVSWLGDCKGILRRRCDQVGARRHVQVHCKGRIVQ
jgi:hypothetical protein